MKMSAKLIYSPTDNETADLHKQVGCMNGFFQLFDSHRRIASHERITNAQPQNRVIRQPGQNGNLEVEANSGLEKAKEKDSKKAIKEKETKKVVKEKRRSSTESSSRHSFSSSSCSSSFSSLDFNKTTNTEPSNSSQNSLTLTQFSRKSVDLRDVVKDSMRREARGLSVKTTAKEPALRTLKYLDSPRPTEGPKSSANSRPTKGLRRLSYDGGESQDGLKSRDLPRLSLDSRHGSAGPSFLSDLRIEKRTRNEAANLLQEPGSSKRASSVVAKLMGLVDPVPTMDEPPRLERIGPSPLSRPSSKTTELRSLKIPVETAPWRQLKGVRGSPAKASATPLTVFGEIEKRLADLEFKKSGKNLRALKQILEAMQKSKAAALDDKKDSRLASQESYDDDDNKSNPSARSPIVIMKPARLLGRHAESASAASLVDGKKVPRNGKPVQTRKVTDVSGTTSPRLNPRRVGSDKQSYPVGPADSKIRSRTSNKQSLESSSPGRKFRPRSDRERWSESNASPLQSESNVSLASEDIDSEVTSIVQPDQNNRSVGLGTNRKTAEPGRAAPEQPSPISVLDAAFYRDESPSPVKKTSSAFKDDEILYPDELEGAMIDHDQQSNGRKSSLVSKADDCLFIESANPDHIYISDILSASGLKRETNVPFNLKLFFALEQHWARTLLHSKPDEKAHRKLVFDAVNEILARRRLSADKPVREGNRKLLLELCSEVDRLQGKSSGEEEDEEDKLRSVVREDMARWPMNGKEYGKEVPAVVLDVERLIFKDLVTELVTGIKSRPGLLCKQLCFN